MQVVGMTEATTNMDDPMQRNQEDDSLLPVGTPTSVRQVVPLRLFTTQEIDALARCAGFRVAAMFGGLEEGVSIKTTRARFID